MIHRGAIAVAWEGLPYYAARLLRRVAQERDLSIISTPGPLMREEIVGILGREVTWVGGSRNISWHSLGLGVPEWFFVSGWSNPQYNLLASQARKAGAYIVIMADNSRKHNFRQAVGSIMFRVKWRPVFDYAFVPGQSGRDLMRFYGMPEHRIRTGLYGADPQVFSAGPPLLARDRDFLFVGQFIERKGLRTLIESVGEIRRTGATFTVAALGAGPMEDALRTSGITVLPFGDASYVSKEMKRSRFLVLPSLEDHWGVVVHEAASSGCGLILSDGVGASRDLLTVDNGFICRRGDPRSLTCAMSTALRIPGAQLENFEGSSLRLASRFGPDHFAAAVSDILSLGLSSPPVPRGTTRHVGPSP